MTEPTSTPEGTPATPAAAEPAAGDEGKVSRSVLQQQGADYKQQLADRDKNNAELTDRLSKYEAADKLKEDERLKAAGDWEELEKKLRGENADLQQKFTNQALDNKRSSLRFELIGAGLDPKDAKDAFTIDGIVAKYDGSTEAAEYFTAFKSENEGLFEKAPVTRNTGSAAGSVGAAGVPNDIDKLVNDFNSGKDWAVNEILKLNGAGKLSPEVQARLVMR